MRVGRLSKSSSFTVLMMQTNISREALYELVWATPVKTLAVQYELSDVGFAKTCKQHHIPLPPRGHWAKLEAGKKVYRQPLPERQLGMPRNVLIGGHRWDYYGPAPKNLIELELTAPKPFDEPLADIRAKLIKKVKKVTVARDLSTAHPVIRKLIDADVPRRKKYLKSTYRSIFDAPYFDSPFEQWRLVGSRPTMQVDNPIYRTLPCRIGQIREKRGGDSWAAIIEKPVKVRSDELDVTIGSRCQIDKEAMGAHIRAILWLQ